MEYFDMDKDTLLNKLAAYRTRKTLMRQEMDEVDEEINKVVVILILHDYLDLIRDVVKR